MGTLSAGNESVGKHNLVLKRPPGPDEAIVNNLFLRPEIRTLFALS